MLRAITRPALAQAGVADVLRALRGGLGVDEVRLNVTVDDVIRRAWIVGDEVDVLEVPAALPASLVRVPLSFDGVVGTLASSRVEVGDTASLLRYVADDIAVVVRREREADLLTRRLQRADTESMRLRHVMTATPDGLALINGDGRVVAWNQAMEQLTGLPRQAALLRPLVDLLAFRDDRGQLIGSAGPLSLRAAMRGEPPKIRDVLSLDVGGHPVWLEIGCAATTDVVAPGSAAGPVTVVLVARDVTEQRDVARLKDDFVATISHEIRTPLTPLRAAVELLVSDLALSAQDRRDVFGTMERQILRLDRLVTDFMTVADLGRQLVAGSPTHVDLVATVQTLLGARAPSQLARVEVVADGPVTMLTSQEGVARVAEALIDNALTHTDGPVSVTIRATTSDAELVVRDEGAGIPKHHVATVLEPFGRLGSHLNRAQGAGLGLTIALAICGRLGGDMTIGSIEGQGTVVTVKVPLGLASRPPRTDPQA